MKIFQDASNVTFQVLSQIYTQVIESFFSFAKKFGRG